MVLLFDHLLGVIFDAAHDEFAALINILNSLIKDCNIHTVNHNFYCWLRCWFSARFYNRRLIYDHLIAIIIYRGVFIFRIRKVFVFCNHFDPFCLTIKVRICEFISNASEVKNSKERLSIFLFDSCAATDDLFKLGHRSDIAIKHN